MGTAHDPAAAARSLAYPIFRCPSRCPGLTRTDRPAAPGATRPVAAAGHHGRRNPPPSRMTFQPADPSETLPPANAADTAHAMQPPFAIALLLRRPLPAPDAPREPAARSPVG